MKDALLIIRDQLTMGYKLSFAEAMLLQQAIDVAVSHVGDSAGKVPDGYKLVPIEPTPEMIAATEIDGDEYYFESDEAAETWMANKFKAMLAAAPIPTK